MNFPGMNWFIGVVEDLNDPEEMDRVRVRIHGYHTEMKEYLPTASLHWAIVLDPTTSASVSGVGESHGLVCGSWVMGMFMDGEDMHLPAVMFSMKGKPNVKLPASKGFADPGGEFPRYIDEPDTNRLARNDKIDSTIVQTKKDGVVKGVSTSDGGSWDEPITTYDALYPHNKVKETRSGHIEEFDDTPGKERIHRYHKSGTFEEIHPDGTVVEKVVKDKYTLTLGDDHIYVGGSVKVHIEGDADVVVSGGMSAMVEGTAKIESKSKVSVKAPLIENNAGEGVVTGACVCHFTGRPHGDISTTVTAGK